MLKLNLILKHKQTQMLYWVIAAVMCLLYCIFWGLPQLSAHTLPFSFEWDSWMKIKNICIFRNVKKHIWNAACSISQLMCLQHTHTHTHTHTAAAVITVTRSSYPHNVRFHHPDLNFKERIHPKINILSVFIHPHVISNLYPVFLQWNTEVDIFDISLCSFCLTTAVHNDRRL